MNPKNTLMLLALAAGLFAFIFFFERHRKTETPPVLKVLPGLRPSDIHSIRIQPLQSKLEEIRAERTTNGGWQLTKPLIYPAETVRVNRLLLELMHLKPQLHLSGLDLKGRRVNEEYGFDTPRFRIIIDDNQLILNLGKLTAPGDQVYAQVVGTEGVDLVDANLLRYIPSEAGDWRDSLFVDLKGLDFDRLGVANSSGKFELQRETTNGLWRLARPDVARADNPRIAGLLTNLQGLLVARFQTDDTNADLEPFGLKPPALELTFDHGTNHLLSLQFGKSPTNAAALLYARRDTGPAVVLVSRDPLAGWNDSAKLFRDHRLARFDPGDAAAIEVRGQSNFPAFALRRQTNNAWRVTSPLECPADAELVRNFLRRLGGMEVVLNDGNVAVQDIVAESLLPGYGLAPPARQYFVKRNPDQAGATNAVIAEIDFGSEKDGRVFARRGDLPDERSVYAVSVTNFNALPASGMALRERRIWNFTPDDVSTITTKLDGKPLEMTREGANKWKPGTSDRVIEPIMIEAGADELGTLAAEAWVDRGSDKLARYGFTDKSLQIAVKLRGKEPAQTLTVDFGGYSPRGLRYGAARMEDGEIWIFECPANSFDKFAAYFNLREKGAP
jgi:hypothetical protein